jgi:hypothetical protein
MSWMRIQSCVRLMVYRCTEVMTIRNWNYYKNSHLSESDDCYGATPLGIFIYRACVFSVTSLPGYGLQSHKTDKLEGLYVIYRQQLFKSGYISFVVIEFYCFKQCNNIQWRLIIKY